jgi:copper oxidase (laccase) domain-containing protein
MISGLVLTSAEGFDYLHFPPWSAAGLLHGFIGTALNFRGDALGPSAAKFLAAFGLKRLYLLRQVHGDNVLNSTEKIEWNGAWTGKEGEVLRAEGGADAWHLPKGPRPGEAFGILTADCAPILLKKQGASSPAAMVHAGWRGLSRGIVEKCAALVGESCEGVIGPCAGEGRYEVGEEVIAALGPRAVHVPATSGKYYLSMARSSARALELAGAKPLHCSERCTISDRSFHSFRRDGEMMGLNLAFIAKALSGR